MIVQIDSTGAHDLPTEASGGVARTSIDAFGDYALLVRTPYRGIYSGHVGTTGDVWVGGVASDGLLTVSYGGQPYMAVVQPSGDFNGGAATSRGLGTFAGHLTVDSSGKNGIAATLGRATGSVSLAGARANVDVQITLVNPPANNAYEISQVPAMPTIQATATILNPDDAPGCVLTELKWKTTVAYSGKGNSLARAVPEISAAPATTSHASEVYTADFGSNIRGGDLNVMVHTSIDGVDFDKMVTGTIQGHSPSVSQIEGYLGDNDDLKRIVHHESLSKKNHAYWVQFDTPVEGVGEPLWSSDGYYGAGLGQVTPANDDQVWSWTANLDGAKSKFTSTTKTAKDLNNHVASDYANNATWIKKVKEYNDKVRKGKPPIQIIIPNRTAEQIRREAIRGYNGWAGVDPNTGQKPLRECWIARNATTGYLDVTDVDETALTGYVHWEIVPSEDRPDAGESDYVNLVLATAP